MALLKAVRTVLHWGRDLFYCGQDGRVRSCPWTSAGVDANPKNLKSCLLVFTFQGQSQDNPFNSLLRFQRPLVYSLHSTSRYVVWYGVETPDCEISVFIPNPLLIGYLYVVRSLLCSRSRLNLHCTFRRAARTYSQW